MSEWIASRYEIVERLGSGGGGTVFLANDRSLEKTVVLKADKRKPSARKELLRREVDVLKDLKHPNIPTVLDFFHEGETVYTVMEYIEGESLDKPLKRGEHFSQPQVIEWAIELLKALSYLHKPIHGDPPRGFVHGDIKPANLMRRSDQSICLIDFNIALALGETNIIGCSPGYASPEHYGLDFSSGSDTISTVGDSTVFDKTQREADDLSEDRTVVEEKSAEGSRKSYSLTKKTVVPDIRSDIYSVGATLYHLLSGQKPARNALEVVPLSEKGISPRLAAIIAKAMNPNPDLRYQTAEEMLKAFSDLRKKDPRLIRLKRIRCAVGAFLTALFFAGGAASFLGLKRMEITENWLKLSEYSRNAFLDGNPELALAYALQAMPIGNNFLEPAATAEAQVALTNALGVYDLSDGYKAFGQIELPSAPFDIQIAPDGGTAACVYASEFALIDLEQGIVNAVFPAVSSALAEVEYLDSDCVLFAGENGITAYNIKTDRILWSGEEATAIAVSGDHSTAASIYGQESQAMIYDVSEGKLLSTVDFNGRRQSMAVNPSFANPKDNLFELNESGTLLAVSFEDGSLELFNLENSDDGIVIFEKGSGYTHFEGGFYENYFAFSASGSENSIFAVIDTVSGIQTGGFESDYPFGVMTDDNGIYVQTENVFVRLHPVTGEQKPLVTVSEPILQFARSDSYTIILTQEEFLIFNSNAECISSVPKDFGNGFVQIAENVAVTGNRDGGTLKLLRLETHPEAEILSYDPSYVHDEARISADKNTVMLFRYDRFRIYGRDGTVLAECLIPDGEDVYDQQFIRTEEGSWLEVIYNDGRVLGYRASDGVLDYERKIKPPDPTLYEKFETEQLLFSSPLHGPVSVYDRETGNLVRELEEDAYLTYVTEIGQGIVVQYVTADGFFYGQLLNGQCQILAELPYLCDVIDGQLVFDYPTGNLRESRIYSIDELIDMAHKIMIGGK